MWNRGRRRTDARRRAAGILAEVLFRISTPLIALAERLFDYSDPMPPENPEQVRFVRAALLAAQREIEENRAAHEKSVRDEWLSKGHSSLSSRHH